MQPSHITIRSLNALDLVQLFFAALCLGAASGTGPEAIDKGLLFLQFFLLTLKSTHLGIALFLLLLQVGGVVAEISC